MYLSQLHRIIRPIATYFVSETIEFQRTSFLQDGPGPKSVHHLRKRYGTGGLRRLRIGNAVRNVGFVEFRGVADTTRAVDGRFSVPRYGWRGFGVGRSYVRSKDHSIDGNLGGDDHKRYGASLSARYISSYH